MDTNTTDKEYEHFSCFYDTKEMRDNYPKNYPTEWSKNVVLNPGRIICTPEIGLFATILVTLKKNLSYAERNKQIREEMEIRNVLIAEPTNRKYESLNN